MYEKCYFCLDQLPKLKKESTASFFVNFGRSRGTKEPTYITVLTLQWWGSTYKPGLDLGSGTGTAACCWDAACHCQSKGETGINQNWEIESWVNSLDMKPPKMRPLM